MLAQNFKTADELELTDEQHGALCKVLALLDSGQLTHSRLVKGPSITPHQPKSFSGLFNMGSWSVVADCGTVCCIGGTAEILAGKEIFFDGREGPNMKFGGPLYGLFYPEEAMGSFALITPAQSAIALRSYLTTGEARWDLALAE